MSSALYLCYENKLFEWNCFISFKFWKSSFSLSQKLPTYLDCLETLAWVLSKPFETICASQADSIAVAREICKQILLVVCKQKVWKNSHIYD